MLPYNIALGTVFTESEINELKKSHSFSQEYELKYLSGIGNLLNVIEIDRCIQEYELDDSIHTSQSFPHYIGADPGYGIDSTFAIG